MDHASVSLSNLVLSRCNGEPPAPAEWPVEQDALVIAIVRCAAKQATQIVQSLGLSKRVDLESFARIVGLIAGGSTGLLKVLTGLEVALSSKALPDAEAIYLSAYRAMRKGG